LKRQLFHFFHAQQNLASLDFPLPRHGHFDTPGAKAVN
jgi:hypothetical protein